VLPVQMFSLGRTKNGPQRLSTKGCGTGRPHYEGHGKRWKEARYGARGKKDTDRGKERPKTGKTSCLHVALFMTKRGVIAKILYTFPLKRIQCTSSIGRGLGVYDMGFPHAWETIRLFLVKEKSHPHPLEVLV